MSKFGKVVNCEFTGDWKHPSSNKVYNYHKVTFDNGDIGNHGCEDKYPATLTVGNLIEYEMNGEKVKVLKVVSHYSKTNKGKSTDSTPTTKTYSKGKSQDEFLGYAFGYAKDLIIAGKTMADIDELDKMATYIYQRIGVLLTTNKVTPPPVKEPIASTKGADDDFEDVEFNPND